MRQIFPPEQTAQIKLDNISIQACLNPASPQNSRDSIIVIVVLSARVPGQTLLIKLDDSLRNTSVCLLGWNKVCFIASLPLDEEHQLSRRVSSSNNSLRIKTTLKPSH